MAQGEYQKAQVKAGIFTFALMKRWLPLLICLLHFLTLTWFARQHPIGTFATETDFYHLYAPDAERIAAGQFPLNTYQGPGYPATIALIAGLTGVDLFTIGKWLSVVCSVLCGFLTFTLFERAFSYWVGIGAQLMMMVSGQFPQFSINAATDVFFLLLCLSTLVLFTGQWLSVRRRIALTGALTGLAFLTRYNGLVLLVGCLPAIIFLDLFEQRWRNRWVLSAVLIAAFLVVVAPWLYLNDKHRGSPFYNTNYLNLATEFYPELVDGKTNQDGTRALEQEFRSFIDVLRYNPKRIIAHYPLNLWESLTLTIRGDLVNQLVGWAALAGALIALIKRESKAVIFLLVTGLIYLLMMALNHWETRYYFLIMVLCAGFAVYAVSLLGGLFGERRRLPAGLVSVGLVGVMWVMSAAESRRDVGNFLAGHPMEIVAARDYLSGIPTDGRKLRIVARKPHLPYLSRNEWVFFPQVKSLDEFRVWVENNQVDFIAVGKRELKERKELAALGDPKMAPQWLKAAWVNEDPVFILYRPNRDRPNRDRPNRPDP